MKIDFKELILEFNNNLKLDYDLKKKNWFNIGGKTKAFYKAGDLKELIKFLKKIQDKEKIFILGAGSNTLISDNKFDGVVIKLAKNFNNISLHSKEIIVAGSAVTDKSLSEFAMENSLGGFEFLSCIPGTVGGGIRTIDDAKSIFDVVNATQIPDDAYWIWSNDAGGNETFGNVSVVTQLLIHQ